MTPITLLGGAVYVIGGITLAIWGLLTLDRSYHLATDTKLFLSLACFVIGLCLTVVGLNSLAPHYGRFLAEITRHG